MFEQLPSIDQVLMIETVEGLCKKYRRSFVTNAARAVVDEIRIKIKSGEKFESGENGKIPDEIIIAKIKEKISAMTTPSLRRTVNATGVVVHTNLGRSPLSPLLIDSIKNILGSYSNLEYDLETGKRGSRHSHLARLITEVTGAEDGFAVNNNAASVLVVLNSLAKGKEVITSRGELIEIGGSFRIPDIIESGGARLREVGTTNKTRLSDYEKAITLDTAMILKVHPSNYKIQGFTEEASIKELAELGAKRNLCVVYDLGSGLLEGLEEIGITDELPVRKYLEAGADIVTFSGDKLLGGPQAGFIVGKTEYVQMIQKNPMVRAMRVGKLTIAAIETMLIAYLSKEGLFDKIPTLHLLSRSPAWIESAAKNLAGKISGLWPEAKVSVIEDESFAGGGSLPAVPLKTSVITIESPDVSAEELAKLMRSAPVPVIGRIKHGVFCLDCRTILGGDAAHIFSAVEYAKNQEK